MNKIYFILITCSVFLSLSCGLKEKWVNGDKNNPDNTICFNNQKIEARFKMIDNFGNFYFEEREFTIEEKIINDKKQGLALYILKEDKTLKYSVLPEMIVDSTHRRYDIRTGLAQLETKVMLMNLLNSKIAIYRDGIDSLPARYGFMGRAAGGLEFVKIK